MKPLWKLSTLLGVAVLAASCSSNGEKSDDKSADTGTDKKASEVKVSEEWMKKPVELTYYYNYSDNNEKSFMEDEAALMTKKFPNVTFKFVNNVKGQSIEDLLAAGQRIDFIGTLASDIPRLQDLKMIDDLSDLIASHKVDMGIYDDRPMNAMKQQTGGKIAGFPTTVNSLTVYYNKDIFDKFAVPYLKDGMTWDEVLPLAQKMTRNDGGVQYFGFGLHVNVLQVNDKAPQFINPQTQAATLNNDYWKKMFDRWLPLLNIASSAEDRAKMAAYPYDQFKKERTIGMIVANSSAWGFNKNVEGQPLNFDIAQFPTFKDLPNAGPPANPFYYLVSKTSPDREAVFNVLKYRSSEEMLQHYARIGKIVALKDRKWLNEFGKEEPLLQSVNAKSVIPKQYGDVIVNNIYGAQAVSAMNGQFAEVVKGTKDVNTALRDAEEAANKKIAELKAR